MKGDGIKLSGCVDEFDCICIKKKKETESTSAVRFKDTSGIVFYPFVDTKKKCLLTSGSEFFGRAQLSYSFYRKEKKCVPTTGKGFIIR